MISLLLLLFLINYSACKPKIIYQPVAVGEEKIAGKIIAGVVTFEPGQNPQAGYYIVTPAFVLKAGYLAMENAELKLTIKKLQAIIEKGKE